MQKVPTIFERDWDGDPSRVLDQQVPGCEWVFQGFGEPKRKYDGVCVMFNGRTWWTRREVKAGKAAPDNFVALATDDETGDTVGWEPIGQSAFALWHKEALDGEWEDDHVGWLPGTYELIGPKINGNPEKLEHHFLIRHDATPEVVLRERTFEALKTLFEARDIEGIVFHNADGRMAKIKKRDFGLKRES